MNDTRALMGFVLAAARALRDENGDAAFARLAQVIVGCFADDVAIDIADARGCARRITAARSTLGKSPRPVDIAVKRPVGESYSGRDTQLDAAVAELRKRVR